MVGEAGLERGYWQVTLGSVHTLSFFCDDLQFNTWQQFAYRPGDMSLVFSL